MKTQSINSMIKGSTNEELRKLRLTIEKINTNGSHKSQIMKINREFKRRGL